MKKKSKTQVIVNKAGWGHLFYLSIIIAISVVVNIIFWYQIKELPFFTHLLLDESAYHIKAEKILSDGWLGSSTFYQSPLFPYFLAIVYKIFGHDPNMIRVLNIILAQVNILLMYGIAKRLYNTKTGLVCALLVSFYGLLTFYNGFVLKVTLSMTLTCLLLYFLLSTLKKPTPRGYFLAGICIGINILLRGNFLFVAPGIFFWIWFSNTDMRLKVRYVVPLTLGALMMVLPVTARNFYLEKDFVLTSYQAGANFYIGNNSNATGSFTWFDFLRADPRFEENDFNRKAEELAGRPLKPSQISWFWFRQGFQFIGDDPLGFAQVTLKKLLFLVSNQEVDDNHNFYEIRVYTPAIIPFFIGFGLLLVLSIPGLISFQGKREERSLFLFFIVSYSLSMVFFFVLGRYRVLLVPALAPFAAGFICEGWMILKKEKKRLPVALGLTVLAGVISFWPLNITDSHMFHNNLGVAYDKAGNTEKAINEYQRAIAQKPNFPDAYNNMGTSLTKAGRIGEAKTAFITSLRIKPGYAEAHYNLGLLYGMTNQGKKAMEEMQKAFVLDPTLLNMNLK